MTTPKDMVDMVLLRLESKIESGDIKDPKLSGVAMFGQGCVQVPPDHSMSIMFQLANKGSNVKASLAQVSDTCLGAWVEFDTIKDFSVKQPIGYSGVLTVEAFANLLKPFFTTPQNKDAFILDLRRKVIPAVSDDLSFKDKWVKITYSPAKKGYEFEGPVSFIGFSGHIKGIINPEAQIIKASLYLQPLTILDSNIKFLTSDINPAPSSMAIVNIEYTPSIPPTQQVSIDSTIEAFQIKKKVKASITRTDLSLDLDGVKPFNGFLPMLIRIQGPYASSIKSVALTAHG